ncbi:MAG: hypothetical protein IGS23_06530 [Rivularia sp. T60_A2020_040]|nr:hypothetical protein [Rivularia sp. T60_A2020_040]
MLLKNKELQRSTQLLIPLKYVFIHTINVLFVIYYLSISMAICLQQRFAIALVFTKSRCSRFDYVEVADFNEEQVRAFAEHWFGTVCGDGNVGENKAREFLEQLFREENKPIRELAITPILLSLTCLVFRGKGQFYSQRSKLYEEGLELLLVQWDKSREVERDEVYRDLSVERKLELLSYVAVKKFEQEQYVLFEQEELEGYIGEFLGIERRESQGVMRAIASVHGLLIERSHKVWSFSHLTFQEYLVAKFLVISSNWAELLEYITQAQYREIFLMTSELLEQADCFASLIKTKIDRLVASDNILQEFLKVVYQTSSQLRTDLNTVYTRAFLFSAYGDYSFSSLSNSESNLIKEKLSDKLELSDITKLGFPGFELVILSACQSGLTDSLVTDEVLEVNSYFDNLEHNTLGSFWNLRKELPTKDIGISSLEKWIKYDYEHWIQRLRKVMLEFHKLNEAMQFSHKQQKILKEYYEANRLLADCLNRASLISEQVRNEIEETIFLPITEIEKRKRENIE